MVDRIFTNFRILLWCSVLKMVLSQLNIVISYETGDCDVENFFRKQLTAEVLEEFYKCGVIHWNFMPCSTSAMANGVLVCRQGETQCAADRIHACAATLYQNDQLKVGKFVICYFNSQNAEQCACQSGMKWDTIEQCVKKKNGDKYCNAFFDFIINDWQTLLAPGIMFGSKYDANLNVDATKNFKSVLCAQLKKNDLECSACSCN